MNESKGIIDKIVNIAKKQLEEYGASLTRIVDNENVYDVTISLKKNNINGRYHPKSISFSYAAEAGFFIDIDGVTLEFGKDTYTYEAEAQKYINAIKNDRLVRTTKKRFGFSLGDKITIE